MHKVSQQQCLNQTEMTQLAGAFVKQNLSGKLAFAVELSGELGAGKTFFATETMRALGVEAQSITSPTYALCNEYEVKERRLKLLHFDFYRLETPHDFFARGFNEMVEDQTVGVFYEWGQKISPEALSCFAGPHFLVEIERDNQETIRTVTIWEK